MDLRRRFELGDDGVDSDGRLASPASYAMREFDVPFTILRPNYFYQNDARLQTSK
jgi:hypothetical protein